MKSDREQDLVNKVAKLSEELTNTMGQNLVLKNNQVSKDFLCVGPFQTPNPPPSKQWGRIAFYAFTLNCYNITFTGKPLPAIFAPK